MWPQRVTNAPAELRKEGTTIMMNPSDRKDSLVPADFNYSIGRDTFFLPAHQTSLVELHFDGGCSTFGDMQVFDWFERNAPGRRQEKAHISDGPADERERAKECFEQYAKDLGGIVLFAQSAKYRINLPKPSRKTCLALGGNWGYPSGQG